MPYVIPDIPAGESKSRHALAYARLGWFLVPVQRGSKHPGSLLGKKWQEQSSNSAAQVRRWWREYPDAEIALHCGRSGLVVIDVDHPDAVPPVLKKVLDAGDTPLALTRKDSASDGERGHYFFEQPPGRMLGNSPGALGKGWGEIRGDNGVVILAGSEHYHEVFPDRAEAERLAAEAAGLVWQPGHYAWLRTGPVRVLPSEIADLLGEAVEHASAETPAVVNGWLEAHSASDGWCPEAASGPIRWFLGQVEAEAGLSRHDVGRDAVCMALRESAVGAYPVAPVLVELKKVWEASLAEGPRGQRSPGAGEWDSFLLWSVGQMRIFEADPDAQLDIQGRLRRAHGVSSQAAMGISAPEFQRVWEGGYFGPARMRARYDAWVAALVGVQAERMPDVPNPQVRESVIEAGVGRAEAVAGGGGEDWTPPAADGDGEEVEVALREYSLRDPGQDTRWLLNEMGQLGLSGMFRRGPHVVYTPHIDEQGYLEPDPDVVDTTGPYQVQRVTGSVLRARVSVNYLIVRYKKAGSGKASSVKPTYPLFPLECAIAALDAQEGDAVNLRELRGTTHTPMVRADGSLLDVPGFDKATGYLYLPTEGMEGVKVGERPSRREVRSATRLLRGMIGQFPWVSIHDEANYLGLLLTPLLRLVAPPPYKLGVFNATNPGTGKSLLVDVMGQIHGIEKYNEMPGSAEELDKVLAGVLSTTTNPVVCFDNVVGVLRSSKMAALLTSASYSARILGTTNSTGLINDRLWTVTGNAVALGGDMPRRALWISLDTGLPNPELRRGFSVDLVGGWALEHRVELFSALLTWVRNWASAGMKVDRTVGEDSYGKWIGIVRGVLEAAGVPGVFGHETSTKVTVSEDDTEWGDLLAAIERRFGEGSWTVADLFVHVEGMGVGPEEVTGALPNTLLEKFLKAGPAGPTVVARSLGKWLQNRVGRWAGGLAVTDAGMDRTKKRRWRVRKMG